MESLITELRKRFAASRTMKSGYYPLKLIDSDYPAWAFRLDDDRFGVAIPYEGEFINEDFNNINLRSDIYWMDEKNQSLLFLTSNTEDSREQFAVFCYSFISPGIDGINRRSILSDPIAWWKEWKELVGNSSVDKKPYAVVGELIVLKQLLKLGKNPRWGGPEASTRDIEIQNAEYEVKSTLNRYSQQITVSSQFQLQHSDKEIFLIFNRFEKKDNGESINSLVNQLVSQYGYSEEKLEKSLWKLGYKKGTSSRNEKYTLLDQQCYRIDDDFPVIDNTSFVNGQIPHGIIKIEYTIDLSSCHPSPNPLI